MPDFPILQELGEAEFVFPRSYSLIDLDLDTTDTPPMRLEEKTHPEFTLMGDDDETEEEAHPHLQYRQKVDDQLHEVEEVAEMFGKEQALS